jgi:hypothetical protein
VHRHRSRRELFTAIGGAVGVVVVTAIMVWLLRPGPSGTQGTGGLGNPQPRATWLVVHTVVAARAAQGRSGSSGGWRAGPSSSSRWAASHPALRP